jgi:hypothetical protein
VATYALVHSWYAIESPDGEGTWVDPDPPKPLPVYRGPELPDIEMLAYPSPGLETFEEYVATYQSKSTFAFGGADRCHDPVPQVSDPELFV